MHFRPFPVFLDYVFLSGKSADPRKEGKDIDDCQPRINNVFKRVDNVDVDGKSVDNVDVDGKNGMDGV